MDMYLIFLDSDKTNVKAIFRDPVEAESYRQNNLPCDLIPVKVHSYDDATPVVISLD